MGYTTEFNGTLKFNKPVTDELKAYINAFSDTRRMQRNNEKIKELFPNWKQRCFHGNLGQDGEYFVGGTGMCGQDRDDSIMQYNYPARTQPGLWCQWAINDDGELEWDGAEKFYNYVEWLEYLIDNFFIPDNYVLNGDIEWQGEDSEDFGIIHVVDNVVKAVMGRKTYEEEDEDITDDQMFDNVVARLCKIYDLKVTHPYGDAYIELLDNDGCKVASINPKGYNFLSCLASLTMQLYKKFEYDR